LQDKAPPELFTNVCTSRGLSFCSENRMGKFGLGVFPIIIIFAGISYPQNMQADSYDFTVFGGINLLLISAFLNVMINNQI